MNIWDFYTINRNLLVNDVLCYVGKEINSKSDKIKLSLSLEYPLKEIIRQSKHSNYEKPLYISFYTVVKEFTNSFEMIDNNVITMSRKEGHLLNFIYTLELEPSIFKIFDMYTFLDACVSENGNPELFWNFSLTKQACYLSKLRNEKKTASLCFISMLATTNSNCFAEYNVDESICGFLFFRIHQQSLFLFGIEGTDKFIEQSSLKVSKIAKKKKVLLSESPSTLILFPTWEIYDESDGWITMSKFSNNETLNHSNHRCCAVGTAESDSDSDSDSDFDSHSGQNSNKNETENSVIDTKIEIQCKDVEATILKTASLIIEPIGVSIVSTIPSEDVTAPNLEENKMKIIMNQKEFIDLQTKETESQNMSIKSALDTINIQQDVIDKQNQEIVALTERIVPVHPKKDNDSDVEEPNGVFNTVDDLIRSDDELGETEITGY